MFSFFYLYNAKQKFLDETPSEISDMIVSFGTELSDIFKIIMKEMIQKITNLFEEQDVSTNEKINLAKCALSHSIIFPVRLV